MENYNDAAFKNYNEKGLEACPNCARTFLPDRLEIHLKSCNKKHGVGPEENKVKESKSPPGRGISR